MDSTISNIANFETIFSRKKALRSQVRKQLLAMPLSQRQEEDAAIQKHILEASWFRSSNRLCAYISCEALREVDTSKILSEILTDTSSVKKKLYVPRVEDKNSNMRMLNITRLDDLVANSMNILEPSLIDANGNEREDVMLTNEPVDVFLLPGLAFDKSGKRLGRGGGYYDEFLSKYQGLANVRGWRPSLLVALSYSQQIMDEGVIDVTPNDISIDALVTPSGIVLVNPALEKI